MFWAILVVVAVLLGVIGFWSGYSWIDNTQISVLSAVLTIVLLSFVVMTVGEWIVGVFLALWPLIGVWLGTHWNELTRSLAA